MDVHLVSTVKAYRRLADELVEGDDTVLEVGCSTGRTTEILAAKAAHVVAVDHSKVTTDEAKRAVEGTDNVEVRLCDVRDTSALEALGSTPSVLFFDVGGDTPFDRVSLLVRPCLRLFDLRLLVVRCIEWAALASQVVTVEAPKNPVLRSSGVTRPVDHRRSALPDLLELSRSRSAGDRRYAVRRLRSFRHHPEVRMRLEEMRDDRSPSVRRLVRALLKRR